MPAERAIDSNVSEDCQYLDESRLPAKVRDARLTYIRQVLLFVSDSPDRIIRILAHEK